MMENDLERKKEGWSKVERSKSVDRDWQWLTSSEEILKGEKN